MNKGEWSEFYTFLRLLAEGKLCVADSNLNKIEGFYYPIIKIIRQSKNYKEPLFYKIAGNYISIINSANDSELNKIPSEKFSTNADKLLKIIKEASKRSFDAREIESFTTEIEFPLIKEKSLSKRDITIIIHDIETGYKPKVGFSIKSKIGGDPTLFNANPTNNLQYKVEGRDKGAEARCAGELKFVESKKVVKSLK